MKAWNDFLDKYYPDANRADSGVIYGDTAAQTLVHVLQTCGDNLTRENVILRLCPHFAGADDEVQGRNVGTVRRHHRQ